MYNLWKKIIQLLLLGIVVCSMFIVSVSATSVVLDTSNPKVGDIVTISCSANPSVTYDTSLEIITECDRENDAYIKQIPQMYFPSTPNEITVTTYPVQSLSVTFLGLTLSPDVTDEIASITLDDIIQGEWDFKAVGYANGPDPVTLHILQSWRSSTSNTGEYAHQINTINYPVGHYTFTFNDQPVSFDLEEAPTYSISGLVSYNGDPVQGATLDLYEIILPSEQGEPWIETLVDTFITEIDGTYSFNQLSPSNYEVRINVEEPVPYEHSKQYFSLEEEVTRNFPISEWLDIHYPEDYGIVNEINPVIEWPPSDLVENYHLAIFFEDEVWSWNTENPFLEIPIDLIPGAMYSCNIRGYSSKGIQVSISAVTFVVSETAGPTLYHSGILDTWSYRGHRRNSQYKILDSQWMLKELVGDRLQLTMNMECMNTGGPIGSRGKRFSIESTLKTDIFSVESGKIRLSGTLIQEITYENGASQVRERIVRVVIDPDNYRSQFYLRYYENGVSRRLFGSLLQ